MNDLANHTTQCWRDLTKSV